jgi:hypothetical protein
MILVIYIYILIVKNLLPPTGRREVEVISEIRIQRIEDMQVETRSEQQLFLCAQRRGNKIRLEKSDLDMQFWAFSFLSLLYILLRSLNHMYRFTTIYIALSQEY